MFCVISCFNSIFLDRPGKAPCSKGQGTVNTNTINSYVVLVSDSSLGHKTVSRITYHRSMNVQGKRPFPMSKPATRPVPEQTTALRKAAPRDAQPPSKITRNVPQGMGPANKRGRPIVQ